MGSIYGEWADQDSNVLSGIIQSSNNNQISLNAAIAESDHLRADLVSLQPVGLTITPGERVPNVVQAVQSTIGAALGDIGQAGTASQEPGGGGIPCFLGNTLVSMWRKPFSLKREEMQFSVLYEAFHRKPHTGDNKEWKEYLKNLEWFAFSFDENDNPVKGKILNVFRNTVYEYLHVTFRDGYDEPATDVVPMHRYFTPDREYVPIKDLLDKEIMHEESWRNRTGNVSGITVKSIDEVKVPKGIYVYNLAIETYENYCANRHRVHNIKPENEPFNG